MTRTPRPKVKAAAGTSGAAIVLLYLLRLVGVDVDAIPPEVAGVAVGGLGVLAAYLRRDGLAGTWERIVNGEDRS
jgi:hypothetical protein